jgi:hypothetical protein
MLRWLMHPAICFRWLKPDFFVLRLSARRCRAADADISFAIAAQSFFAIFADFQAFAIRHAAPISSSLFSPIALRHFQMPRFRRYAADTIFI